MSGIVPQGIYSVLCDAILCCWVMSAPADIIFFINLATVLNKYLGLVFVFF